MPYSVPANPAHVPTPIAQEAARVQRDALGQRLLALMQNVAAGDQAAFGKLYDLTNRQVYGLVLRILKNPTIAEEVLTDVYMQLWRQAAHYETGRGTVQAWLMTMARTRALDRLRASSYLQRESGDLEIISLTVATESDTPEETSLLSERQRLVRSALAQLSEEQRALITTAYFEGLSHSELAERFDLPLGTVKTRIRSGMVVLRKQLGVLAKT